MYINNFLNKSLLLKRVQFLMLLFTAVYIHYIRDCNRFLCLVIYDICSHLVSSDNFLYRLIQIQPQIPNKKTAQVSFGTKLFLRFLRQLVDNTKDLLSHFVKGRMLEIIRSTLYCESCVSSPQCGKSWQINLQRSVAHKAYK